MTKLWRKFEPILIALGFLAVAGPLCAAEPYDIPPAKKNHWAWKPPVRGPVPAVRDVAWPRNPIDCWVFARLKEAGLRPAPPAAREPLIRRVTLDLIGLPPTPEEVDAFVTDPAPDAYEKLVDRLLASPHYGERWGRHWLDVARFAESNGYEHDEVRPDAWRYRDYVVRSLNADKPYHRFVQEQLAGDELYPDDAEALVATGFNLLGPDMTDTSDPAQRRQNTVNDMTDTAGLAFLGLTVACARCHDHKFEPIPQSDYYRLQAFFTPAVFRRDLPVAPPQERAAYDAASAAYAELARPIAEEMARLEEPQRRKIREVKLTRLSDEARAAHQTPERSRTAAQKELVEKTNRLIAVKLPEILRAMSAADRDRYRQLEKRLKEFEGQKPAPLPTAMGLQDGRGAPPKTFLLAAGELGNAVEEVQPGYPVILSPGYRSAPAPVQALPASTGRRAALARWIVREDNPLTARVLVNRLWQHHFGRGLVATANDLGVRGEPPSHPELLDWLATEFVARGWSVKAMHRLMLTSATYRQSAQAPAEALAKDPENRLFSRMRHLRLEGEAIRDSLLAVSGRLNPRMGGPGVFPPVPPEAVKGSKVWSPSPDPRDHVRRSIYVFARRNLRFPLLEVFDLPDSNLSCPKREQSTTAPQALALLNADDVVQAAEGLADRLAHEAVLGDDRITRAFRLALGRRPTPTELRAAREFLAQAPLGELCRGLFNLNEFVYLD